MLVGIYSNYDKNADIYCIYENGTIEKKSDYKLDWDIFIIGEERVANRIDISFLIDKNNDYAAQELYLLFTNFF